MATFSHERVEQSGTVSARELVRRRLGAEADPWDLALVQRAATWDQVRMRHLLDSLLAGYPIGAILLCRVAGQASKIIRVDAAGDRYVADAAPDAWQLLDGQQRINALTSLFTGQGHYGRFLLHMTQIRHPPGPTSRRSSKDRALTYITWLEPPQVPENAPSDLPTDVDLVADSATIPDRGRQLDLSRWYAWAEEARSEQVVQALSDLETRTRTAGEILHGIDPEFGSHLTRDDEVAAADRLTRLLHAWTAPTIPVLRAEVASPLDVLEVFTRINLGGVQVAGTDVYLAAVKTFWNDAETRLDRTSAASGRILDRLAALRLVSRLASRSLGNGDLLPLTVDRLTGSRGAALITAMRQLTEPGSRLLTRLAEFSTWLRQCSRLGYGLRLVDSRLWDEVFAWAAVTSEGDEAWWAENHEVLDAYLLGGSLFRYPRVLGDPFRRAALLEALAAGLDDRPFPLRRIVEVARAGNHALAGTRDRIRMLADADDRQWTADRRSALLLSIAQRLPYMTRNIDWDHIFPAAHAHRMWARSPYGRRMHHPYRHLVNSAGNFWALDWSANRSLQDKPPSVKFAELQYPRDHGVWYPIWPRDQWALEPGEIDHFIQVDLALTDDPASIDQAMIIFRDLVTQRAGRVLDLVLEKFPDARLFAADSPVGAIDPASITGPSLGTVFGLTVTPESQDTQPGDSNPKAAAAGTSEACDLGPVWAGRADELWRVWDAVTRRQMTLTTPRKSVSPTLRNRYGFDYVRWIPVRHPHHGTHIGIGVASRRPQAERTPLWLALWHNTGGYATAQDRLLHSALAVKIINEPDATWLPIELDPDASEQQLTDHANHQVGQLRAILQQ